MSSGTSPAAAPAAKPKKPAAPAGPKTIDMIVEAITSLSDRKGSSIQAIKGFILEKHPNVDPVRLKSLFKRALTKGMESGIIVRPKSSDASGTTMTGRLKVDKAKVAALTSDKKPKKAVKKPAAAAKVTTKKVVKATKKPKTDKSPKKLVKSKKSPAAKAKAGEKKPKTKTLTKGTEKKPKTVKQPKVKSAVAKKQTKTPKKPKAPAKSRTTTK